MLGLLLALSGGKLIFGTSTNGTGFFRVNSKVVVSILAAKISWRLFLDFDLVGVLFNLIIGFSRDCLDANVCIDSGADEVLVLGADRNVVRSCLFGDRFFARRSLSEVA